MFSAWSLAILGLLSICLVAYISLRLLLLEVTVNGTSMRPTLESGDHVLVLRHWPVRLLRKGQIIIAYPTIEEPRPIQAIPYVIKRITGLPGDQLTVPTLTGAQLLLRRTSERTSRAWVVPPRHIFIQGDNPLGGVDSTVYGPIPIKQVLGVVIHKLPRKSKIEQPASAGRAKLLGHGPTAGQPAPPFAAETLSGEIVTLERYAGRAIALLFTIPSQICAELIPGYEALRPYAHAAGVDLVLVWNDDMEQARRFVDRLKPTLPILVAPEQDNPMTRDYDIQFWPCYCLIDADGIVRSSGHPIDPAGEWAALAESWRAAGAQARAPVAALGGISHG